jgi:hypothetical protein
LLIVLVGLVIVVPATVSFASWPTVFCVQFAWLAESSEVAVGVVVVLPFESVVEVELMLVTFSLLRSDELDPLSSVVEMLIALAWPVAVERSTRCAPSEPLMTVADTPGLSDAELIAEAMPDSVLLLLSILTVLDLPLMFNVIEPVPSCCVEVNAPEVMDCAAAMLFTLTE